MELETKESFKKADELVEDKLLKYKKKKNIELYKSYRVLSYDLLFYYAIIYLFLTIEKKLTPAQVIQFDAFYILFKFVLQIPITMLIQRIGKRKSLLFANFVNVFHILIIMFAPNFNILLVSQFLSAIGFTTKATCETDMLYDSIEHSEKRGSIFAKIDGKALGRHFYIEAASAMIAGFLFVVNHYLPLIMCLLVSLTSAIISTKFENVETKHHVDSVFEEYGKLRTSLRETLKSKRLVSLLLFNALMIGMIKLLQNARNTVLIEVGMPEQYFGIIFATLGIISGIAARLQNKIHDKYRNKTLTILGFPTALSILFLGIVLMLNLDTQISIPIILVLFLIQYVTKGPYYVLIKRYFNNFTNSEKRVKVATVNNLLENLITSILLFAASFILDKLPINYTLLIIGCASIMLIVVLLDRMRTTVGLKYEQYSNKDLI